MYKSFTVSFCVFSLSVVLSAKEIIYIIVLCGVGLTEMLWKSSSVISREHRSPHRSTQREIDVMTISKSSRSRWTWGKYGDIHNKNASLVTIFNLQRCVVRNVSDLSRLFLIIDLRNL